MWRQDKPDTIGAEQAAAPVSREFMQKILATNILYRFMPFHYHNQWGLIPGATRWGDGGKKKKERRILLILLPFCCHNFLPCKIIKISRLYDSLCSTLQINCSSFSGNLGNLSQLDSSHRLSKSTSNWLSSLSPLHKFHWAYKCRVAFKGLIINANEWLAVGQLCHFSPSPSLLILIRVLFCCLN